MLDSQTTQGRGSKITVLGAASEWHTENIRDMYGIYVDQESIEDHLEPHCIATHEIRSTAAKER
jgi:hypothetical protein